LVVFVEDVKKYITFVLSIQMHAITNSSDEKRSNSCLYFCLLIGYAYL